MHKTEIHHNTHKIDINECIGCGFCAAICPKNAISERPDYAYVINSHCINCSLCKSKCPVNAISSQQKAA